jgi:hypothetical protein
VLEYAQRRGPLSPRRACRQGRVVRDNVSREALGGEK